MLRCVVLTQTVLKQILLRQVVLKQIVRRYIVLNQIVLKRFVFRQTVLKQIVLQQIISDSFWLGRLRSAIVCNAFEYNLKKCAPWLPKGAEREPRSARTASHGVRGGYSGLICAGLR